MMSEIQTINLEVLTKQEKIVLKKRSRTDRIEFPNKYNELVLPIAHYALVSPKFLFKPKLVIYGLGSCIGLILYDKKSRIYAMSHILLPSAKITDKQIELPFPHKYADYSVKELVNEFLSLGVKKTNIKAAIIGGANIFQNKFMDISKRNIKSVKNELKALNIKIMKEDTGGTQGRTIVLDIFENLVIIRRTGEIEYKLNL